MDTKTTAKVEPRKTSDTDKQAVKDAAEVAALVRSVKRWGAIGTFVLGVIGSGNIALNRAAPSKEEIEGAVKSAVKTEVQEVVRKEVEPLKERMTRFEIALELERKRESK